MKKNIRKGFTLIELLVVIAIITIMTTVLLTIVADDRERRQVRTSAELFLSTLRETQNSALTGDLVNGLRPCIFRFSPGVTMYWVSIIGYDPTDDEGGCTKTTRNEVTKRIFFAENVWWESGVGEGEVQFTVPYGNIILGLPSDPSEVASPFVLRKGSHRYLVCLYRSGRVEARGFINSATPTCN